MQPMQQWADTLKQDVASQVDSLRSLKAAAALVPRLALIVDDDPFQRKLLARMLHDDGFEAVFAASALEAMALAGKRRPDIVLMDVDLPDNDGVEATRRLKASSVFAATPVLMITGRGDKDVVLRSVRAGAAGFLVKPVAKDVLRAKVASCLGVVSSPSIA